MAASGKAKRSLTALLIGLSSAACARINDATTPPELLQRAMPSPDSVTVEIFSVLTPWPENDEALWHQVDELILSPERRLEWTRSGMRVGQIRGDVPPHLAKLLQLSDQPASLENEPRAIAVNDEPTVRRRVVQLRYGHRGEILTTGTLPKLNVLLQQEGELRGKTVYQAQGLFAIRLEEAEDGIVRLVATPEIRHGPQRQQFIGEQGVFRVGQAQASLILEQLKLVAELAPAEMLLLTCRPDSAGSLGQRLFSQQSPRGRQRKLLFLRLAEVPSPALFTEDSESAATPPGRLKLLE